MEKPLNVLIVDDSDDDAMLLVEALKRGGYDLVYERVETAEALDLALERHPWDIVVSDYAMPAFSAIETLRLLRSKSVEIPCIIMSGSIGEERAVELLKAGASDFITKGLTVRLLPAIKRELLEAEERRARKRAEKALHEAELKFQSLCESAVDAIFSADHMGQIHSWNEAAQEMFGYRMEDVLGKSAELLIAKRHIKDYRNGLEQARLERKLRATNKAMRVQGVKKDGFEFPMELSLASWQNGSERFYAAIIRDISEREKLETQLRQSQKMEAIGQLAGGIAHDFNNLLTIINGRSQLMISRVKTDDRMRQELEQIYRTGERAASLTRQLLAFSRQQVLQPRPININSIASDMDKMLRRLIREDIAFVTVLDPALARVLADPGQVEQVIMNLVVNARDAMPNGGRLTLETSNVELSEAYCRARAEVKPGHYAMLAVSDNGHGMDATTKSRLFEPFFTTKPQGKGTGLGLSTVFGIVKQSGGHIEVYSELGTGTTFKIYLPQTKDSPAPKTSETLSAVSKGIEVVLVVEDEEGVRELVREVLAMNGYTVLIANNGKEALTLCEAYKCNINLIVTDVVMPELGGPELAERAQALRPGMKVLFTSGYTDNAIIHNGTLDANVDFIQKPFTPAGLAHKVREVLDKG